MSDYLFDFSQLDDIDCLFINYKFLDRLPLFSFSIGIQLMSLKSIYVL